MWKRNCPNCNKEISYSNRCNWNRGNRTDSLCYDCANETRKGRKRTDEQKKLISQKTKIAMEDPIVKQRFLDSYTDENRKKRSESTKQQMKDLKSNKEKYKTWVSLQSESKERYWKKMDESKKRFHLDSLNNGRDIRWNKPNSRYEMSQQMLGNKNHFYGKKHSQKTIEKLRESTTNRLLRFWKDGGLHGTNTKPELLTQNILKKNNIEFITPFVLGNKIFDLYIPKQNVIIEVDGCYWHSKGINIDNMNKQQLRRWKNDRFKDNLVKKNNMKLIRIWEDEINETTLTERIYNI